MKIFIDGRTVRAGRTGVGYYTESMIRALDICPGPERQLSVLTLEPGELGLLSGHVQLIPTTVDYENHPAAELHESIYLPRLLKRGRFDVFWGSAFLIPWVPVACPRIVTVHDLTAFTHPHCYPRRFAFYMRFVIRMAVLHSDAVVCVSEFVANQIRERFPGHAPIHVIPAAADPFFRSSGEENEAGHSRDPFLLAIGAGDPRKDTAFLLRVYRRMRELSPGNVPELLLVGEWPAGSLKEGVRLVPRQSREALRDLYRHSSLFLFPTASEGFGLPVLEAMQCGCPVAASSTGAVPEVVGEAAMFFDHRDEEATARSLVELLGSPERLATMRLGGRARAAGFSWQSSASQLLSLFEQCVKERRAR